MKLKAALLPFLLLLTGADPNNSPQATAAKHSRMKADYVEACSCHLFCPCYFNKHAEHKSCKFNMAVKVREGHSGATNLAGSKYWLTGDLVSPPIGRDTKRSYFGGATGPGLWFSESMVIKKALRPEY